MRKRKILRIIARLNIGGPAIHAILLSEALNKDSYEDKLVCGRVSEHEGDMFYLARQKGVCPTVIPELQREISFKKDLKAFFKLYAMIKRERPDIVHTHTAKAGTLGRLAATLAGVPVKVHTFHGHIFDGYFSPVKAKIFLFIEKVLAVFTDRVIAVSSLMKDDIVKRLKITNEKKCVVIPLGLELEKFSDCEKLKGNFRRKLGIGEDVLLVGIVGRLVPIKNHIMFIKAAKKLIDKTAHRKVKFLIVGDGELKEGLERAVNEMGLKDFVIFTGWIEDLPGVYADLDIVALTSFNEGTPLSLIEAMASAKPVVTTAVGGVKDMIKGGENGLMIGTNDAEDFSDKLSMLIENDGLRRELGVNGRRSVAEKYSKNRLVSDTKKLYEECIREKFPRKYL